jgi:DNA-binding transcriptional MerR regulator
MDRFAKEGGRVGLLEDIRKTEKPGRSGRAFFYAQAIYAHFKEIEELKAEGFTLATIRKFLESKGVLPAGSDTRSFCRAFRREAARRKQVELKEVNADEVRKNGSKGRDAPKREVQAAGVKQGSGVPSIPTKAHKGKAGVQINPDNTFTISPVDPEDLP